MQSEIKFQQTRLQSQQRMEAINRESEARHNQIKSDIQKSKLESQKRHQDFKLKSSSDFWDETTKTVVSAYVEFLRSELKERPLDNVFFDSIIKNAGVIRFEEEKKADNVPDFAKSVRQYWEDRLESATSEEDRKVSKAYRQFASSMERKIQSKGKKFWSDLDSEPENPFE